MKVPPNKLTTVTLPFVARYGRGPQLFALVMSPLILCFILFAKGDDGLPVFIQLWEQGGVEQKVGCVIAFILIPALPIDVFRGRTLFTENEIRHLPAFGRWRTFRYQDIVDLEVFPNEFSRLEFRDGRMLKIWAMRADPQLVEAIIRQKCKPKQVIRSNHAESTGSRESESRGRV